MSKFYVTKYASTKGILTVEADPDITDTGKVVIFNSDGKKFVVGASCFESLDAARHDAIKRTRRKISGLVKKENSLEAAISIWESELPV